MNKPMHNYKIPIAHVTMALAHERDATFKSMLEYVELAMNHHNLAYILRSDYDLVVSEWTKDAPSHDELSEIFRLATLRKSG